MAQSVDQRSLIPKPKRVIKIDRPPPSTEVDAADRAILDLFGDPKTRPPRYARFVFVQRETGERLFEQDELEAIFDESLDHAVTAFGRSPNGGLIVTWGALTALHRDVIIKVAARHRLPAVHAFSAAGKGERAKLMPALPQRAFCEWLGTALLLPAVIAAESARQRKASRR